MVDRRLLSADFNIELNHVNENLAWGMKSWREEPNADPIYLFEVHYWSPKHPEDTVPVYVREKIEARSEEAVLTLVERLVHVLTDEEYREEIREESYKNLDAIGYTRHREARDLTDEV